jgi:hypothetical protein
VSWISQGLGIQMINISTRRKDRLLQGEVGAGIQEGP